MLHILSCDEDTREFFKPIHTFLVDKALVRKGKKLKQLFEKFSFGKSIN